MSETEQELRESLVQYGIPEHMHNGVVLYILHRIDPGHFMVALMSNDLKEAFGRADQDNIAAMFNWVKWFYNEAPNQCWGSAGNVRNWLSQSKVLP